MTDICYTFCNLGWVGCCRDCLWQRWPWVQTLLKYTSNFYSNSIFTAWLLNVVVFSQEDFRCCWTQVQTSCFLKVTWCRFSRVNLLVVFVQLTLAKLMLLRSRPNVRAHNLTFFFDLTTQCQNQHTLLFVCRLIFVWTVSDNVFLNFLLQNQPASFSRNKNCELLTTVVCKRTVVNP